MNNPSAAPQFAFYCLQRAKLQWSEHENALRATEVRDPEDGALLAILLMVDRVDSTQDWLVEAHHLYQQGPHSDEMGPSIILLAKEQTKGRGRRDHRWDSGSVGSRGLESLTFSFSLSLSEVPTLTPLEVALQVCKSFEPGTSLDALAQLKLKWPNDLLNVEQEKVAGILCQSVQDLYQQRCIAGVGINLVRPALIQKKDSDYSPGYLFHQTPPDWNELAASEWKFQYLQCFMLQWKNRLAPAQIIQQWEARAFYLYQPIRYFTDLKNGNLSGETGEGIFLGLGPYGEALVMENDNANIKKLFNESIRPIANESH